MTHCRCFYTTRKGNHSATLIPRVVAVWRPLPSEICAQIMWPTLFEKRDFDRFPLITSQPQEIAKKSSITTNTKSTTGFPRRHRWSAYVIPKCPKGWLEERLFSFFEYKSTGDRLRRCQLSSPASVVNIWWSAAILITPTVDKCM